MNSLITVSKMTSMQIAEVIGKEHFIVLRDIRDEAEKLEKGGIKPSYKFVLSERTDPTGRTIPYYELTKEGVLQLAARYDAVTRAKLIELAMRQDKQLPSNYKEALLALVAAEEEKEQLQAENVQKSQQLEQQKPLVLFAETCIASNDSLLVREVAKLASKQGVIIGEKRLWQKLREWEIVSPSNEPYQRAFEAGWFETKRGTYNTPYGSEAYSTYKVTPKGQIYIIEKLKKSA
jgi:anti-repressor protein